MGVLLKQGQGLPTSSWRMRLSASLTIGCFLAVALVLGTIFWCCWQQSEEYRSSDLAGMAWHAPSAGVCAIFWPWSCHACRIYVFLRAHDEPTSIYRCIV